MDFETTRVKNHQKKIIPRKNQKTTRKKMKTTRKKKTPSNEILDVFYLLFCVGLVFLGVLYRLPSGYDIFREIHRSELFLTLVVCFSSDGFRSGADIFLMTFLFFLMVLE